MLCIAVESGGAVPRIRAAALALTNTLASLRGANDTCSHEAALLPPLLQKVLKAKRAYEAAKVAPSQERVVRCDDVLQRQKWDMDCPHPAHTSGDLNMCFTHEPAWWFKYQDGLVEFALPGPPPGQSWDQCECGIGMTLQRYAKEGLFNLHRAAPPGAEQLYTLYEAGSGWVVDSLEANKAGPTMSDPACCEDGSRGVCRRTCGEWVRAVTEIHRAVRKGDVLVAVNGIPSASLDTPDSLYEQCASRSGDSPPGSLVFYRVPAYGLRGRWKRAHLPLRGEGEEGGGWDTVVGGGWTML